MTDDEKLHRGSRAKEVLENEEFSAAFDAIEQEITEAWKNSPQRDEEGRQRLFLALTMLGKVKASLTQTMETGKIALLEIQHQKSLAERAKAWVSRN